MKQFEHIDFNPLLAELNKNSFKFDTPLLRNKVKEEIKLFTHNLIAERVIPLEQCEDLIRFLEYKIEVIQ